MHSAASSTIAPGSCIVCNNRSASAKISFRRVGQTIVRAPSRLIRTRFSTSAWRSGSERTSGRRSSSDSCVIDQDRRMPLYSRRTNASMRESSAIVKRSSPSRRSSNRSKKRSISVRCPSVVESPFAAARARRACSISPRRLGRRAPSRSKRNQKLPNSKWAAWCVEYTLYTAKFCSLSTCSSENSGK